MTPHIEHRVETKAMIRRRKQRQAIVAALIGAGLALLCRALPVDYQKPCETIIHICTGGN